MSEGNYEQQGKYYIVEDSKTSELSVRIYYTYSHEQGKQLTE